MTSAGTDFASRRAPALVAMLAIVLGLALAAGGLGWEHDPRRDHDHGLEATDGHRVEVAVDRDGFDWPELPAGVDTVFLELDVRAGRRQPFIESRSAVTVERQYLAPRARGRRYLELSGHVGLESGQRVRLIGGLTNWSVGAAGLTAYRNRALDGGTRVLVVAPHPDDAEIGAFGVYHDTDADVVTVTAGDAGGGNFRQLYPDDGSHYRVKGWIRTWDSITVPFFGGVPPGRARNLGYFDATLMRLFRERPKRVGPPLAEIPSDDYYRSFNVPEAGLERPMSSTWPSLVADFEAELERVSPQVIVAPHPFLDGHWDHQLTTVALIEAIESTGCDGCELYLYTNHPIEEELHPFGPRHGVAGLSPWYGEELEFQRLYSHRLSEEVRRQKLIALEAMHDLRRFDLLDRPAERSSPRRRPGQPDYSYYRRAGRPNEVFYVLDVDSAIAMKRRFVEDCEVTAPCPASR